LFLVVNCVFHIGLVMCDNIDLKGFFYLLFSWFTFHQ